MDDAARKAAEEIVAEYEKKWGRMLLGSPIQDFAITIRKHFPTPPEREATGGAMREAAQALVERWQQMPIGAPAGPWMSKVVAQLERALTAECSAAPADVRDMREAFLRWYTEDYTLARDRAGLEEAFQAGATWAQRQGAGERRRHAFDYRKVMFPEKWGEAEERRKSATPPAPQAEKAGLTEEEQQTVSMMAERCRERDNFGPVYVEELIAIIDRLTRKE